MFDVDAFMATTNEGEFETQRPLIPNGEYNAITESVTPKVVGERNLPIMEVKFKLMNTGDEDLDGRQVSHTIWLDVDEAGNLMRGNGKNTMLGQLLSALGLNGTPWQVGMLSGQPVLIAVGSKPNYKDKERMENYVPRIARAV